MSKKDTHLTIRISSEELQEIKDFAASQNESFTDFVMKSIKLQMGHKDEMAERLEKLERAVFAKAA